LEKFHVIYTVHFLAYNILNQQPPTCNRTDSLLYGCYYYKNMELYLLTCVI